MSEEEIKVIKTASCTSLSGLSTITYEIGSQEDSQFIRLSINTAGGLFCKEWISLSDIQKLLSAKQKPTSKTFQPLYAGKSANSPGFLLACILHEKLHANHTHSGPAPETPATKSAKGKKAELPVNQEPSP
jgi:hypothetical protein